MRSHFDKSQASTWMTAIRMNSTLIMFAKWQIINIYFNLDGFSALQSLLPTEYICLLFNFNVNRMVVCKCRMAFDWNRCLVFVRKKIISLSTWCLSILNLCLPTGTLFDVHWTWLIQQSALSGWLDLDRPKLFSLFFSFFVCFIFILLRIPSKSRFIAKIKRFANSMCWN